MRKLLPLFKLGVGGRFGSGRQWMSWIFATNLLADELGAIEHLITSDVTGPVNLTAADAGHQRRVRRRRSAACSTVRP